MQFYDYRPEDIIGTDSTIIGAQKLRFPELVLTAQKGALPAAILAVERVKQYKDQEEISERLPNVTAQVSLEMLAETFTLYHAITGDPLGPMDYGTAVSIIYSFERGLFERAEAIAAAATIIPEPEA